MEKIKGWMLLALVLGFFSNAPARAQPSDPIDCTGGCTIVTCDGSTCWVWQCDASGCRIAGSYRRTSPPAQKLAPSNLIEQPRAFSQVCEVQGNAPCTFKTCQDGQCTVSLFDGEDFVPVGRVEDMDTLIRRASERLDKP
jgi:hypothetical protein